LGDLGASGAGSGDLQSAGGAPQSVGEPPRSVGGFPHSAGGAPQATGVSMGTGGANPIGGGSSSLAGAGSTGPSRGNGLSVCDGTGTRMLTAADALLDNFEGSAPSPAWSSFNDLFDTLGEENLYLTRVAGGANLTHFAGLYTPRPGWTIGVMYNLAVDPAAGVSCADVSAFSGISFWAKASSSVTQIFVSFVTPSRNLIQRDSMGRPIGGDCAGPYLAANKCYEFPGAVVAPTENWTRYSAKFADAAYGSDRIGVANNLIQKITFEEEDVSQKPAAPAGFWLDEVTFF
jgi:hypothetical protein